MKKYVLRMELQTSEVRPRQLRVYREASVRMIESMARLHHVEFRNVMNEKEGHWEIFLTGDPVNVAAVERAFDTRPL